MHNAQTGPGFPDRMVRLLQERGASPFEAARFTRLPPAAQIAAIPYIETGDVELRELITDLEEITEHPQH